jgi:hypothetical protein
MGPLLNICCIQSVSGLLVMIEEKSETTNKSSFVLGTTKLNTNFLTKCISRVIC